MGYLINSTSSGIYTPILSNALNALSNPILINAFYSQVGNIVTCSIYGTVDIDYSLVSSGQFDLTFPILPNTINGNGLVNVEVPNNVNGIVRNNQIALFSNDVTFIGLNVAFYAIFQYNI